jgi:riboflavin synthase
VFTGIVEERGEVRGVGNGRLVVGCRTVATDSPVGASVAVNGTCLTVVERTGADLAFDLSAETLARTSVGRLRPGDPVNLERPVTLAARLGGHLVQGHIDGLGEVTRIEAEGDGGARLHVRVPSDLLPFVVEKGSIAIDGVSLTVAGVADDRIQIALIPHTLAATTLGAVREGDVVNVETDVIAKYVHRSIERRER